MSQSIYESVHMDDRLPMRIVHLNTEDKDSPYAKLLEYIDIDTTVFVAPHWHRSIEFSYIKKGGIKLRLGMKHFEYSAGDFLFVNSGDIHEISNLPGMETEVICFIISYDYCKSLDPKFDHIRFDLNQPSTSKESLVLLFESVLKHYYGNDTMKHLLIRSDLDMIMYYLFRDFQTQSEDGSKILEMIKIQNNNKEVLEYIHENYNEPLSLEDLSKNFHKSREHFARQFKDAFGKPFLEYLIDYRIFRSFEDIVNSNLTIEHISQVHGFPSSKGMITQFKKRYNTTPNEFRKNMDITIIDHKNIQNSPILEAIVNKQP